ncbi:MAG: sporulation protein YabP [Clostridia bacterium]|nr:sporulation protein YabP [Clostridia bacterium]
MENKYHAQSLCIEDRKRLTLSGVIRVNGFTDRRISLTVQTGKLTITGEKLKVNGFSEGTGSFSCEGEIGSLTYTKGNEKLLGRLFK